MQNITYIFNTQKELNAINKFTMEGFTPDYVIELIGKLIKIKRDPKLGKENFWRGCAINLSDVYAYRVKIETVYFGLSFPNAPIGNLNTNNAPSKDDSRIVSTTMVDDQFIIDSWQRFRNWSKTTLTRTSCEIIDSIAISVDGQSITINAKLSEFLQQIILKFFNEEVKPSIIIIFTGETNDQN